MYRIARKRTGAYRITAIAYDADGVEADVTGTLTCVVTHDGATVATVTPANTGGRMVADVGVEHLEHLGEYTAVWGATIGGEAMEWETHFELVGGFMFSIGELRAYEDGTYADTTDFPTSLLEDARLFAEQRLEDTEAAGVAFVPRGAIDTLIIPDTGSPTRLWLTWPKVREVKRVTIDGTDLTADELAEITTENMAISRDTAFAGTVVVEYEHGYTQPSEPVKRAALILAKEYLTNNAPSRVSVESTDIGFVRYTLAASGGKTGIPEVDAIVADERAKARGGRVFVG